MNKELSQSPTYFHDPFEEVESPTRPLASHRHHTVRDDGRESKDFEAPRIFDGLTNILSGWGWLSSEREARSESGKALSRRDSTNMPSFGLDRARSTPATNHEAKAESPTSFAKDYGKFHRVLHYDGSNTVQLYEKKSSVEQIKSPGRSPSSPVVTKLRRASLINKTIRELYAVKMFHSAQTTTPLPYGKRTPSFSLYHPNIIPIIDILYNEQKHLCLVMPYCGGGNLKSFLFPDGPRKDRISNEELDCWIIQIIRAVAFLHEKDIVHGDLRPEHILFTTQGAVKVSGFGEDEDAARELAEFLHGDNRTSCYSESGASSNMTPASNYKPKMCIRRNLSESSVPYLPPERFSGRRGSFHQSYAHHQGFDIRAGDIWACGMIYMVLISGKLLWHRAQRIHPGKPFANYLNYRLTDEGYGPIQSLQLVSYICRFCM